MVNKTNDGLRLISNSEIQTYKDCKRKWWLTYHRGLVEPTPRVGPLAIGTRIHLALAAYYDPNSDDDPMQVLEDIIDLDREKVGEDDISNVILEADLRAAGQSDDLNDTVDYKAIKLAILALVEKSEFLLIESLADRIATLCTQADKVESATVTIDKPGALRFCKSVAVEITRP